MPPCQAVGQWLWTLVLCPKYGAPSLGCCRLLTACTYTLPHPDLGVEEQDSRRLSRTQAQGEVVMSVTYRFLEE